MTSFIETYRHRTGGLYRVDKVEFGWVWITLIATKEQSKLPEDHFLKDWSIDLSQPKHEERVKMITFTIPMPPMSGQFGGKRIQLTGSTIPGKQVRFFKTSQVSNWQSLVRFYSKKYVPEKPIEGPVKLFATFVLERPKMLMTKRYADCRLWAPVTPDHDNAEKLLCDSLSGFWRDDKQICHAQQLKFYAAKNESACIEIFIQELEPFTP